VHRSPAGVAGRTGLAEDEAPGFDLADGICRNHDRSPSISVTTTAVQHARRPPAANGRRGASFWSSVPRTSSSFRNPRDKPVVVVFPLGTRGCKAARILTGAGFPDVRFLDGGLQDWPYDLARVYGLAPLFPGKMGRCLA